MKQFLGRVLGRATPGQVRGVHTREAMQLRLEIERARAVRANRNLALLILEYDLGLEAHDTLMVRLADRVLQRVRLTDELGWLENGRLGVILPDTAREGVQKVADDICQLCDDLPIPNCLVYFHPAESSRNDNGDESSDDELRGDSDDDSRSDEKRRSNGHGRPAAVRPLSEHFELEKARENGNGLSGNGNGNGHGVNGRDGNGQGGVALASRVDAAVATAPCVSRPGHSAAPRISGRRIPEARLEDFFVQPLPLWKRGLDIALALIGMIGLSWLMFIVAVAIKLTSRGRVLFVQRRTGLGSQPFRVYKFRTMYEGAHDEQDELRPQSIQDGPAFKLVDDPRTTVIGRLLRATSIDELPQLWNVLRGEMSIVGPRPLPVAEAALCKPWQQRRHEVTPGLTCIWQVWGRSRVCFDDWIRMDLNYVDRVSAAEDLKLIVATVPAVLARRGAS